MRPLLLLALALADCDTPRGAEAEPPLEPRADTVAAPPADSSAGASAADELARLESEIQTLTQPATATQAASCRAVGYGSRPCGGPSRFTVVSTEKTDTAALSQLTTRYTSLETEENRRTDAVSTCMMLEPPPVALRDGVCVEGR